MSPVEQEYRADYQEHVDEQVDALLGLAVAVVLTAVAVLAVLAVAAQIGHLVGGML